VNRNRIFNRPDEPAWAMAALDVALDGGSGLDGRERLEIRLRDAEMAPVARSKVVKALHPVWINPPEETAAFIAWAKEHAADVAALRPVHLVALMAMYPFFGDLVAAAGRMLKNDGHVDTGLLRDRLKSRWGDRDTIAVAARKGVQTLRSFGVLVGRRGSTQSVPGVRFSMDDDWALWVAAALLLSRSGDTTDAGTVETAPEFFFLDLRVGGFVQVPATRAHHVRDARTRLAFRSA